ncbi:hypothetical protein F5884DRAFT_776589 [Xylogone sp. PMI_703]|nr:hypothetical protein F5884DRAFT_776589 [Xylogone sp. PMI_703]
MGWFWGSDTTGDKKSQDPLKDLDPSLREFLAKESPVRYSPPNPVPLPRTQESAQTEKETGVKQAPKDEPISETKVPPQSLFQDGRYAHLWKTYQSQAEVESAHKSDQEKIDDILEGYKYRKAEIGRAALENCALEQWEVNECFRSGSWASRMTLCREENRSLERCFTMQSKFLKALGYLSTLDRPPEVDERIQMHADTLYHRMLDQEKEMEAAKAEGRPVPSFPPLLTSSNPGLSKADPSAQTPRNDIQIPEAAKERLKDLKGIERELEESAIKAQLAAEAETAQNLQAIWRKQDEERQKRKEQGKETIGDKVFSMFRFR